MACFYVYSESSADLNNLSAEDLKKLPLGQKDSILKYNSLDEIKTAVWKLHLGLFVRYNSDYVSDTKDKIEKAKEKYAKNKNIGLSVTEIATGISNLTNNSKLTSSLLFIKDFQTQFGTKFHKCLEMALKGKDVELIEAKNDLLKFIKAKLNELSRLPQKDITALEGRESTKNVLDFLSNITEDKLFSNVDEAINSILESDYIKGKNLESEFELLGEIESVNPVKGKIDLLSYDKDGNMLVMDFKTASRTGSLKSLLQHYILLECYKRMLQQNGIAWKNIKLVNCEFIYDANGFKFNSFIDSESTIDLISRSNLNSRINLYLPRSVKTIITDDLTSRLSKAEDINKTLFNSKFLNKLETEHYKSYIQEKIKNNQSFKFWKFNVWGSATLEGENIRLKFPDGKEETMALDTFIKDEIQYITDLSQSVVREYLSVLKSNDKDSLQKLLTRDSKSGNSLNQNLGKYLNSTWEVLNNPGLESKGIITIYNLATNTVEYIVLTKDLYLNRHYLLKNGGNLINDIVPESVKIKYLGYDSLPQATLGNVKLMLAMVYISQFNDLLPENSRVGDIKVVSYSDGSSTFNLNFDGFLNSMRILEAEFKDTSSKLEGKEKFSTIYSDSISIKFTDTLERLSDEVAQAVMSLDISFPDHFSNLSLQQKIKKLEHILDEIKSKFPNEFVRNKKELQVTSDILMTYANISKLLQNLRNILSDNIPNITRLGLTFQDSLVAGVYLTTRGEVKSYTTDGYLVTGLCNGLESSVSYRNPDEMSRRINTAIDAYFTLIRKQFLVEIDEVNKAARQYFNYILDNILVGGRILDAVLGYHSPYYKALMEKDPQDPSKVSKVFRFLNPYSTNSGLAEYEKDFLEVILWSINRKRIPTMQLSADLKKLSYADLKKNKEGFKTYQALINNNINWLNIPLKSASGARGLALGVQAFLKGDKSFRQVYEDLLDRFKEFLNPQRLTSYQLQERTERENALESYNQFAEDSESRGIRLENSLPTDYEWNLTTLANDYTLAYITSDVLKKILRTIDDLIFTLRAIENMTGQDMSSRIDSIFKRVKVSIYNDTLVDPEYRDLMTFIGFAKSVGSYTKIAIRPMLYFKEMVLGGLKNTSSVVAGFISNGNKITFPILMEAAKYVYGQSLFTEKWEKLTKGLDLGEKDLLGLINDEYAITDRDANAIALKISADNYGIFNQGSRTLFYNTVRPDWFNRMTIFVAKMIADGTWDAHKKGENGTLEYDMSKDKRFSEFWTHRNDKSYSTPEFEKLKALYLTMMKQFESEGFNVNYGQNGSNYDPLPMAYTTLERNSIKEQIGLLYGFYDHEEKTILQNETWYQMFTLFLTYLPGEAQKWIAVGRESSVGHYILEVDPVEKDADGNPAKLYWEEDSLGNKIKTTRAVSESGKNNQPILSWSGHPVEGLLVSLVKTCHDLVLDREKLKLNPLEWKNALLALFNILYGALFGTLMLRILTGGTGDKKDLTTQTAMIYDLNRKIANDIDFYDSVVKPVMDFNFAGTQYVSDIIGDTIKALTNGEYKAMNAFYDNLSVLKDTHILD